jgi:hypothetical protein
MIRLQVEKSLSDRSSSDAPKSRQCLKCRVDFPSEWSGERVCPRCKKTTGWRSGVQARVM